MPALRARVASLDRNIAVSRVITMKEVVDNAVWQERFFATVFAGFGALAFVLAVVGLYGVMSYAVDRRTHEMGIRMALGATAAAIRRMILWQSGRLTAAGLALRAIPPPLVAVAALVASYMPARKATRVDPMLALREE